MRRAGRAVEERARRVTNSHSMTTEEVAKIMSGAATRATKGLREVSDAIAELREAELMLEGLAAAQMLVENRKPPKDENPRLAYRFQRSRESLGCTVGRSNIKSKQASSKSLISSVRGSSRRKA